MLLVQLHLKKIQNKIIASHSTSSVLEGCWYKMDGPFKAAFPHLTKGTSYLTEKILTNFTSDLIRYFKFSTSNNHILSFQWLCESCYTKLIKSDRALESQKWGQELCIFSFEATCGFGCVLCPCLALQLTSLVASKLFGLGIYVFQPHYSASLLTKHCFLS